MAKIQPPKGYITATEVKNRLNISDAMIRYYVQKEKIKYLVPPGRKQGFYREQDVDKLANELNAFLHFEEEKEHVKLAMATEKDLLACSAITRALFADDDEEAPITPPERIATWIKKNPQVVYVLRELSKKNDTKTYKVVGYVYALPLKPDNEKLKEILIADLLGEVNITPDDIEEYKPGKDLVIYIAAIAVHPDIERDKRKFYGSILVGGFIDKIIDLGKKGVVIKELLAIGATHQGVRLLQTFGFSEIRPLKPGKRIFSLKVEESGANVAEQYRKAFAEWEEEQKTTEKITM